MAPRRKPKPDLTSRLKNKPPCRVFCRPCCYVFSALSILIGCIALVVILVSIYPLPLNRLKDWIIRESKSEEGLKLLPCNNFKVSDVWLVNLPKLTSESPIRLLDINNDGIEDLIFGFGTDETDNDVPPDIFCKIFMDIPAPCDGGLIALNGVNGEIIWRHWLNDTIFNLHCTEDVNGDNVNDCLAVGFDGTITVINPLNGSTIWQLNTNRMNVFVANFIADQNFDNVSDIITSHSAVEGNEGHLIMLSGKTGQELKRLKAPNGEQTFYMPQLLKTSENSTYVLFGTGTPFKKGNLSVVPIEDLASGNLTINVKTLYADKFKGMLTQSVLVDITNDGVPDIITAMYNSTVVAINGKTFAQIWNYTVPNSETTITPTPGFFNYDNIPDFLIVYQKYDNILNYNYTQTFILDGKTGKSIYQPFGGSVISQLNGLVLCTEGYGYDSFLYWTSDCDYDQINNTNNCLVQYNSTNRFKLNALNQFHQPPGFVIYDSVNRSNTEFNFTESILLKIREYMAKNPSIQFKGQSEVDEKYNVDSAPIGIRKYESSSFRHKDNKNGIVKDFLSSINSAPIPNQPVEQEPPMPNYDFDSNVEQGIDDLPDYNLESMVPYNQKELIFNTNEQKTNERDPRSKEKNAPQTKSKKKNLSDKKFGVFDYENVKNARSRLLHDINNLPTKILRETYFENEEKQLRKSKFEERDIDSHIDKMKENEEVKKTIEKEKKALQNRSLNLWDLESEKENQDRENNYWRNKRNINYLFDKIRKITSVGAILNPLNISKSGTNSIDIVFLIYWLPSQKSQELVRQNDMELCIKEKMLKASNSTKVLTSTKEERRKLSQSECLDDESYVKRIFPFLDQMFLVRLGVMTVYRLTITCECEKTGNENERCPRFLSKDSQSWPEFLGKKGDGYFYSKN